MEVEFSIHGYINFGNITVKVSNLKPHTGIMPMNIIHFSGNYNYRPT